MAFQTISGPLPAPEERSCGGDPRGAESVQVRQAGETVVGAREEPNLFVQFVRFLAAGGIAAACNIGSRWLLSHLLPFEIAIVLAYLVGMVVAFGIMRSFVFRPSSHLSKSIELGRFALVNVLGLAQTLVVSLVVARWLAPRLGFHQHAEGIGHVLGVGVPVFTSFVCHRRFSFAKKASPPPP